MRALVFAVSVIVALVVTAAAAADGLPVLGMLSGSLRRFRGRPAPA